MKELRKQYRYGRPSFEFDKIDEKQSAKRQKIDSYEESIEIKNEHIYQQLSNEMYGKIENGECFNLKFIEYSLIKLVLSKYNRTQSAKLLNISVRTLRNKINEYGFKHIQPDSQILH